MLLYLAVVFGVGGGWLWWLASADGRLRLIGGLVLLAITIALAVVVRRRARRLSSSFEWISSRAITHGGVGDSRWNRARRDHPDDPDDFESHVGGWGL